MMKKLGSACLVLVAMTGACKKTEKKEEPKAADPAPAKTTEPASAPTPAPAPAAAPAASSATASTKADGTCADGFADVGGLGVCAKLPAGLKPDPSYTKGAGEKGVMYNGGPNIFLVISTKPYQAEKWATSLQDLVYEDPGVGAKLMEEKASGGDGKWVVMDMPPSGQRASQSLTHNKTTTLKCYAQGEVQGSKPSAAEMIEICKSIALSGPN